MRIGIVTGEYPPLQGGVGAYTRILAEQFTQLGHRVYIFSRAGTHSTHPDIILDNHSRTWGYGSLRAIRRWARQLKLDIINLQFQTAAYQMSPWVHFIPDMIGSAPLITTFHDLRIPYLFPKAGRLRDWIVMRLASASDGVIATNHEDARRLEHLPRARMIPMGNTAGSGLPEGFDAQEWRQKAGAAPGDFLIGHFGFVNRSKGLENLLASVAALHKEGLAPRLLMIGDRTGSSDPTNAAYVGEIDAMIARLEIETLIHWTGFVDEAAVSAYLTACDVIALPFRDGASYRRSSLITALHHARPIVTTRPKVAIPAFVDGYNMALVAADDAPALSETLRQLGTSPALRAQLASGAGALASQLDWSQIARDYIVFFEEALQ